MNDEMKSSATPTKSGAEDDAWPDRHSHEPASFEASDGGVVAEEPPTVDVKEESAFEYRRRRSSVSGSPMCVAPTGSFGHAEHVEAPLANQLRRQSGGEDNGSSVSGDFSDGRSIQHRLRKISTFAKHSAVRVLELLNSDEEVVDDYTTINERISYNRSYLRRFQYYTMRHASQSMALWALFAVIEMLMIAVYIASTGYMQSEPSWTAYDADNNSRLFYARVALSFLSIPQLFFAFTLHWSDRLALTATTLYQIAIFGASLWDASISTYYVPFFVRVWSLRGYLQLILDSANVISRNPILLASRSVAKTLASFAALIVSFTGVYRINESFQGEPVAFAQALYLMIVTCTTVGYGDITPHTASGRALMIFFIFMFVATLPVVLSKLTAIAEYLRSVKGFEGGTRHVVVVGTPTYKEVLTLLEEFIAFSMNRTIVFVMLNGVSARMRTLECSPLYRNRVVFVGVDFLRDPLLMKRCRAADADAIIVVSEKHALCGHGDYSAMMASLLFSRYVSSVPQILMLRYGTHTSLLNDAQATLVMDVMKKAILSSALLMPGVVPLLVNLTRFSGSKGDVDSRIWSAEVHEKPEADWRDLYRYSRRNVMHVLRPPLFLVGLTQRGIAKSFSYERMVLVGVTKSEDAVPILDLEAVVNEGDLLLVIAEKASDRDLQEAMSRTEAFITGGVKGKRYDESRVFSPPHVASEEMQPSSFTAGHLFMGTQQESFYPFQRTVENLSATASLDGTTSAFGSTSFVGSIEEMCRRYPFINTHPRGIDIRSLPFAESDRSAILGLLFRRDEAMNTSNDEDESAALHVEEEINEMLKEIADKHLKRLLDEEKARRVLQKQGVERFVLIDQATTVTEPMLSDYDRDFSVSMAEQSLMVMMLCLRSIYSKSVMTLLTLNAIRPEFMDAWNKAFQSPLRLVKGQGTLVSHTEHALRIDHPNSTHHKCGVRGVLIFCSQQGQREYEDVPILTVERNVDLALSEAMRHNTIDPDQERNIVVELKTFTSCPMFYPQHMDLKWRRLGEDSFQECLPFMMGKCFSSDMLQTMLVHCFYHSAILRWYEMILNVSVNDARVDLQLNESAPRARTRFKFYGNVFMGLKTYGDAFRLILKHRNSVCVGVFRRFPASERLEGTPRYFITNPGTAMPLLADDILYALFAGHVSEGLTANAPVARRNTSNLSDSTITRRTMSKGSVGSRRLSGSQLTAEEFMDEGYTA